MLIIEPSARRQIGGSTRPQPWDPWRCPGDLSLHRCSRHGDREQHPWAAHPLAAPTRAPRRGFPLQEPLRSVFYRVQTAPSPLRAGETPGACCLVLGWEAPSRRCRRARCLPCGTGSSPRVFLSFGKKIKNKTHPLSKSYKCLRNLRCSSSPGALLVPEHLLRHRASRPSCANGQPR